MQNRLMLRRLPGKNTEESSPHYVAQQSSLKSNRGSFDSAGAKNAPASLRMTIFLLVQHVKLT
jgi:hypothetical protein